jgi:hypothetical protein
MLSPEGREHVVTLIAQAGDGEASDRMALRASSNHAHASEQVESMPPYFSTDLPAPFHALIPPLSDLAC